LIKLELCHVTAVEEGQALKVETSGLTLAVFNVLGEYFVTDDLCTHGPGSLSESYILDDVVECNFHNGAFNIKTGEVISAPSTENLKTYPVKIINHHVCIEVSQKG
jgi:biphenyl 2,3-dioxygenase ferredoxin subunit